MGKRLFIFNILQGMFLYILCSYFILVQQKCLIDKVSEAIQLRIEATICGNPSTKALNLFR